MDYHDLEDRAQELAKRAVRRPLPLGTVVDMLDSVNLGSFVRPEERKAARQQDQGGAKPGAGQG